MPEEVQAVFEKMVAKKVQDRYQTMSDVVADLEKCASGQPTSLSAQLSADPSPDADTLTFLRDIPLQTRHTSKLAKKTVAAKTGKNNKKLIPIAVGGAVLGLAILAAVILKLQTKDGTLIVTVNQPDAVVQVLNEKGKVEISDRAGKRRSPSPSIRASTGSRWRRTDSNSLPKTLRSSRVAVRRFRRRCCRRLPRSRMSTIRGSSNG